MQSEERAAQVQHADRELAPLDAGARVEWALGNLGARPVLSSSFGVQAAVMLHLVSRRAPGLPVILVDTGYLFPETYRFVDELVERLDLDLHVYRAQRSPAWQEARYGRLWEQGIDGLERYNRINKVEPLRTALRELDADLWFAGLRRQQSASRANAPFATWRHGVVKVHPIADWTDRDVHRYLRRHDLPYHPLWAKGYVSIGDVHTTRPLTADISEEETRFFGLQRECGLHEAG